MPTRTALTVRTAQRAGSPDRPTEDRVYLTDNAVIVLDGATDPRGLEYSGGWMATQTGTRFQHRLIDEPEADLRETLRSIVQELIRDFGLVAGQAPSTTLAVVRVNGEQLDAFVVADSPIVVKQTSGQLVQIRDDRIAEISARYPRPTAKPDRADPRWVDRYNSIEQHRNQSGGFWAVSASPEVADEAVSESFEVAEVESCLLMTDGISVLGDRYEPDGWDPIYDSVVADPGNAIKRTVDLEETDEQFLRWPRSKIHDDKAIASIDIR